MSRRHGWVMGLGAVLMSVGAQADVCIFDAQRYWKVEPASLLSLGKNTPYSGLEVKGRVTHTLVGGMIAHELRVHETR